MGKRRAVPADYSAGPGSVTGKGESSAGAEEVRELIDATPFMKNTPRGSGLLRHDLATGRAKG